MNINFKNLENNDVIQLKNYFKNCGYLPSNYSSVFAVMWKRHLGMQYAVIENCLVLKNNFAGKCYFYYPMSCGNDEAEDRALLAIENYCREMNVKLNFSAVPEQKILKIVNRYGVDVKLLNSRKWRDYLYYSEDFIFYRGKKFSGQRNHLNKFAKLYPDYTFTVLGENDVEEIYSFLKIYESRQLLKGSVMAEEEMEGVYGLLPYLGALEIKVGALKANGNIVALSMAERCGDQLIIHVEKALTEYAGAYPTIAHETAKAFAEGAKYINREDDSGDSGLRKSKLQYNPCILVAKYDVTPLRAIDGMSKIPSIACKRVKIGEITQEFADEFYRLEYDADRNKYWGFSWRDFVKGEPDSNFFLSCIRNDFLKKNEIPMGIFFNGKLAGEVVLHNFGYSSDCEVGFRLLPEFEGMGIAFEAASAVIEYALMELNLEVVYAKCFKANVKSKKTLERLRMRYTGEDETYYYFKITAKD